MRTVMLLLALAAVGCSTSGTSVQIGAKTYAPTTPDSIVLLIEPPAEKHEIIALVEGEAATDDYFTKPRTEAAAIKAMREEAARIGANAIVLTGKGVRPYGQVSIANSVGGATVAPGSISGYSSTVSTGLGWEKITFSGTAIRYVGE